MAVLEIKGISYAYEKNKPILKSVTAEFETGKMYAILGQSGCGKTTLLSLLGGLDTAQSGEILFNGEDITIRGLEHHRLNNVSIIFQSYNLIDYLTPVENANLISKKNALPILQQLGLAGLYYSAFRENQG